MMWAPTRGILAAVCCVGLACSGPDSDDLVDGPGLVEVIVTPPPGALFAPESLQVLSLYQVADVGTNGVALVTHNTGTRNIAWALDADENVVMAGFIDEVDREISAETTAEVLLYLGLRTTTQPYEVQERVRNALLPSEGFDDLVSAVGQTIAADPTAVQTGALNDTLSAHVDALYEGIPTIMGTEFQLQAEPATELNGYQVAEHDLEHFVITNTKRRRSHAFLYPLSVTSEAGATTEIDDEIVGPDVPIRDVAVTPTLAIRGFSGVLQDWAKGSGIEFAATTTAPVYAPIGDGNDEATYAVRVVSPGDLSRFQRKRLTTAEDEELDRLILETFAFDWVLPVFLDMAGHAKVFGKDGAFPSQALTDFLDAFKDLLASTPSINDKLKVGDYTGAMDDFAFAFLNNLGSSVFEDFVKLAVGGLLESLDLEMPIDDAGKTPLTKALKVFEVTDITMKAVDYTRVYGAGLGSPLTEFEVIVDRTDVNLEPKRIKTVPFVRETFRAYPRNTVPDDAVLKYTWTTTGTYGLLQDNRGRWGTTLVTSDDNVTFDPNRLVSESVTETVTVLIEYEVNGEEPVELGSADSTITVVPNEQVLDPEKPRVQCRTDVQLHLERSDGEINIVDNPSWDYRVDWFTTGLYGHLSGGGDSVTTYDQPYVTYSCTDEDAVDKTETIRANIYRKEKDETRWTQIDRVRGEILIDNDENKLIYHKKLEVIEREIPQSNPAYEGWSAMLIARIPPVVGDREPISYTARTYGFDVRPAWLARSITWKEGERNPEGLPAVLYGEDEHLYEGSYVWMVSATGCQGGKGGGCNAEAAAQYGDVYRTFGGHVEIIVDLKP